MPVPKRKVSKARRNKRFANSGICPCSVMLCLTCQAPILPHQVCHACGHYKGVKVIKTKKDRMYQRSKMRKEAKSEANPVGKE